MVDFPVPVSSKGAVWPSAGFGSVYDRLAPPEGAPDSQFPEIVPPAKSLGPSPVRAASGITIGPQAGLPRQDAGSLFKPLGDWLGEVNTALETSGDAQERLAAGEPVDIHSVMVGLEKATIGLQLTTQVRNKLLEAYQEVFRMSV